MHNLLRVLHSLDGVAVVFDITNLGIEKAFLLEVCRGEHPQEFTKEQSPLPFTLMKP